MQDFIHVNAESFEEASKELAGGSRYQNQPMAGGTDLMTELRTRILPEYPTKVVNLKSIKDAEYIEGAGEVKIGALTKLKDVESCDLLPDVLKEAAHSVATPLVRNKATIGGNICQDVRCWFYRYPENSGGALNCAHKSGTQCYAVKGDARFHSIFGGMKTSSLVGCGSGCPNNTDIPGYMEKLRKGDWQAAAEIFFRVNPMPMITSRVCAHPCQDHCNRMNVMATQALADHDDCVSIHTVERALGDYVREHKDVFYKKPEAETGKKIAVVGSGPAGLTAAYYLRKAGHTVTVIDRMEKAGGMLQYAIPNYRLPQEYVNELVEALEGMGIEFKLKTELGKDIQAADLENGYDKVFYATGAWKRPVLGFDGEDFTEFGLDFLVEVNEWMNKKERKNVLVVGGGNVAMDVAVTAKRLGAETVTMACLESEGEMPASPEEIERAKEEGIQIMPSWGVKCAIREGDKVTGMELKRCTSVFDENHRFSPAYDENETIVVNADAILMAAGQQVDLSFLKEDYDIAVERGRFAVADDDTQKTSRKDVYAGGDAVSGPSTVISSIRQGRNAAEAINEDLGIARPVYKHDGFLKFDPVFETMKTGVKDITLPVPERAIDKEDTSTISKEAAEEEACRCMNCGCYSVNASDISPALLLLDADIVTTEKTIKADEFFTSCLDVKDQLKPGELVKEIVIKPEADTITHYEKFRIRKSLDFAIVSLATSYKKGGTDIKMVLGGVAPVPVRLTEVEEFLSGKKLTEDVINEAAELAVKDALPIRTNVYKVQEVRVMVKRFLEGIQA